jgi:hypothetical protein
MSKLHRFEHRPSALESSIRPRDMISFQVIFSIIVSFLIYIFTTMCYIWLIFGWSLTLFFSGHVFFQSSLGVWYAPHLLIQVFLFSYGYVQCYTHIGDNAWFKFGGMEEWNTVQYFAMLSLRIWLSFNSDLYFIGELNMMNT